MKLILKSLLLAVFLIILSSLPIVDIGVLWRHIYRIAKDHVPLIVFIATISGAFTVFLRQRKKKSVSAVCLDTETSECESSTAFSKNVVTSQDSVIYSFLRLYQSQLGADESAATQIRKVDAPPSPGLDSTVELRVKHQGQWESRRMSIGRLGEESGSKSTCYYVIYNINMVIKIPPKPIRRFKKYVEMIRADSRIAAQLAPKVCIVPKISVIQRQLHQFPEEERYSANELEEKYIEWIKKHEMLQEYLKIGGAFVFFMDLSKHYFLGLIISRLHDVREKIEQEITDYAHLIWDIYGFEGRYGQRNSAHCLALQAAFNSFESDIRDIAKQYGLVSKIDVYMIKDWFLGLITGQEIDFERENFNGSMISQITQTIDMVKGECEQPLTDYRKLIEDYAFTLSLSQNRKAFEGIVTNLIELLIWLVEKGVAMRDLKPDNLLVVGDTTQFPHLLQSPENFSIGLIDVETAVIFNESQGEMKQPQLGGTPYYATPSHFIKNDYLRTVFGDVGLILHHQDWHAILVIIFRVVTGLRLFDRSGRLLGDMIKTMCDKNFVQTESLEKNMEEASRSYWAMAQAEFQYKMNKHRDVLTTIHINFADLKVGSLLRKITKEKALVEHLIQDSIANQSYFRNQKHQKQFVGATAQRIYQISKKWEKENALHQMGAEQQKQAFAFLKNLENLKEKNERYAHFIDIISRKEYVLSVYEWLYIMFDINVSVMHQRKWGPLGRGHRADLETEK